MIFTEFLVCIVLDHFKTICKTGGPKIISALANCLRGEYEEALCGTRLEIGRN